jgi:hypothetical protein
MGLLSYLRGDDLLEDRSTEPKRESRWLPPAEKQLPLMGAYALSSVMPTQAPAITAGGAAVRLTRVSSGKWRQRAGRFGGRGSVWLIGRRRPPSPVCTPRGSRGSLSSGLRLMARVSLNLNDAIAALDAGEVKPARLEIPALPDQPGFRELTAEAVDAMADRLFRPPPPSPPVWLAEVAAIVAEELKPVVRAEVRGALKRQRSDAGKTAS